MTDNYKLLLAKTEDMIRLCDKYSSAVFSDFLDGGEAAQLKSSFRFPYGYNFMFFGGCDDCERQILGIFPEWEEADAKAFPISVLKIEGGYNRKLTHRDYLGTIMSLGIERKKTGDILIEDKCAYVFIYADVAEYVERSISKIGNQGVKTSLVTLDDFKPPKRQMQLIETVCASLRLDAVVGACANVSRQESAKLISCGGVKLNSRETLETAKSVKVGDLISVRGFGKFILSDTGGETRKGRLHIELSKYI